MMAAELAQRSHHLFRFFSSLVPLSGAISRKLLSPFETALITESVRAGSLIYPLRRAEVGWLCVIGLSGCRSQATSLNYWWNSQKAANNKGLCHWFDSTVCLFFFFSGILLGTSVLSVRSGFAALLFS